MPSASSPATAIPPNQDHDVSFDPDPNSTDEVGSGPEWLTRLRERAHLRSRRGRDTVWGPNRTPSEPLPVTLNQIWPAIRRETRVRSQHGQVDADLSSRLHGDPRRDVSASRATWISVCAGF